MSSLNGTPLAPVPGPDRILALDPGRPPVLMTLVVAEEEFDWEEDFDRDATQVTAIRNVVHGQEVFEAAGIVPTYVVDYPVANDPESARVLREIFDSGRGLLGAHLHPWVTPPFEEEVNVRNSFPGNLGAELEAANMRQLMERIEEVFGQRPRVYQAGRYGLGPDTAAILAREGIEVDLSATPPFDYSEQGGPDFSAYPADPWWLDRPGGVLEIPTTGAYVGFLRSGVHRIYRAVTRPALRWTRLPGLLARVGALERLRLTPEGHELDDLVRLTRSLLARGTRIFTFSYHAPSLKPGCTQYVRDERELEHFHERCRRYFEFFMGELGGRSLTPLELREELVSPSAADPA